ncbi:MAG: thioredoxin [Clostridiales bacterium]|nr:thioredoxin [Clostridiales bacterium]
MIKIIDKNEFDELLNKKDKLIIIDFFAQWCMPCKMLAPVIETVSEKYADVEFYKVDIDLNEELVSKYEIEGVPTLIFIKDGKLINQEVGYRSESELNMLIEKYK